MQVRMYFPPSNCTGTRWLGLQSSRSKPKLPIWNVTGNMLLAVLELPHYWGPRKMREGKWITGGRIKQKCFYWQSKLLLLILSEVYFTSMHDGAGCQNKNAINGWRGVSRKWIWEDINRFVRSEYSASESFESGNVCEQREWYFKTKTFKAFSFCSKRCIGGIR